MSLTTTLQVPRPFRRKPVDHGPQDPQPLPVIAILCWLTILLALMIVDTHLGARYGLLFAGYAIVAQATRLPRALPTTAGLSVLFAAITLMASQTPVPTHLPPTPKTHRPHTNPAAHPNTSTTPNPNVNLFAPTS